MLSGLAGAILGNFLSKDQEDNQRPTPPQYPQPYQPQLQQGFPQPYITPQNVAPSYINRDRIENNPRMQVYAPQQSAPIANAPQILDLSNQYREKSKRIKELFNLALGVYQSMGENYKIFSEFNKIDNYIKYIDNKSNEINKNLGVLIKYIKEIRSNFDTNIPITYFDDPRGNLYNIIKTLITSDISQLNDATRQIAALQKILKATKNNLGLVIAAYKIYQDKITSYEFFIKSKAIEIDDLLISADKKDEDFISFLNSTNGIQKCMEITQEQISVVNTYNLYNGTLNSTELTNVDFIPLSMLPHQWFNESDAEYYPLIKKLLDTTSAYDCDQWTLAKLMGRSETPKPKQEPVQV